MRASLVAALVSAGLLAGCGVGSVATGDPGSPVTVSVGARAVGAPIPDGFLGFSFEFQAVRAYTGRDPAAINPVLVQLLANLTPGQAPVIRIGGDSTDISYLPAPGVRPPPFAGYRLTPGWLATTAALAHRLGARMIMGVNLAADDPALAAAEGRAFLRALGPGTLEALEIGNEPNVYSKVAVFHTLSGAPVTARPPGFGYPAFARQFGAIAAALPAVPLAGPALAAGPVAGPGSWVKVVPDLLAREPRLAIMTVHRYPLRNCFVAPSSPQYPSVAHLLSSYATVGLAASLRPWLAIAHRAHRLLRVDEVNSVACRGKPGVSDTFASALWATDAMFALARAGVDGVDLHTLPRSSYQLFQFARVDGRWRGRAAPVYYGLALFAQAAPVGARLLAISRGGDDRGLSAWATRAPDGTVRVVLIDKDPSRARVVTLSLPPGAGSTATVERMLAPSVYSRGDVTLGGASAGAFTGRLAPPRPAAVSAAGGRLTLSVPGGSAALVTVAPGA